MTSESMSKYSIAKHRRWWTDIAGFFIWCLIQVVCMTLRIKNEREADEDEYDQTFLACLWHNRNFVCPYVWDQSGYQQEMGAFTSASKDGALLASVVKRFGMQSYRGSTHRRGVTAFLEAKNSVEKGACLAITPDGPKGPIYKIQPGIIKLASLTGIPIVMFCVEYENCWRVNSAWDKYCVPKPFSKVNILWRKPVYIPRDLDESTMREYVEKIELAMRTGKPDFESL